MSRRRFGRVVQALLRPFGVRLQRIRPTWFLAGDAGGPAGGLEGSWLDRFQFKTVMDIGAHEGAFSEWALRRFPQAEVLAFEPQRVCYERLLAKFSGERRFKAFHVALGAAEGAGSLVRSRYTPASSLLKMTAIHGDEFPFAEGGDPEPVPVSTLDSFVQSQGLRGAAMMKIDVQGYEGEVLKGAAETLKRTDFLVVELSLEQLYQGQPLFADLYPSLVASGFRYRGNVGQLRSPRDGRTLQVDAAFSRVESDPQKAQELAAHVE